MGVTGCGKSTVGEILATRLNLPFLDADNFHNDENKLKMNQGIPLNDDDRIPWLSLISEVLTDQQNKGGAILACSALKKQYRELLQRNLPSTIIWVHLSGSAELISERLNNRKGHFMSPDLLNSQFETLEYPDGALTISIKKSPENIVEEIINEIYQNES